MRLRLGMMILVPSLALKGRERDDYEAAAQRVPSLGFLYCRGWARVTSCGLTNINACVSTVTLGCRLTTPAYHRVQ